MRAGIDIMTERKIVNRMECPYCEITFNNHVTLELHKCSCSPYVEPTFYMPESTYNDLVELQRKQKGTLEGNDEIYR